MMFTMLMVMMNDDDVHDIDDDEHGDVDEYDR